MLKCCGRILKPKLLAFSDNEGLKSLKVATCTNENCLTLVVEITKINLFGRTETTTLRGKKAKNYLDENRGRIVEAYKRFRQSKKDTAKGFFYACPEHDLLANVYTGKQERRALSTDYLDGKNDVETNILAVEQETFDLDFDFAIDNLLNTPATLISEDVFSENLEKNLEELFPGRTIESRDD